MVNAQTTAFTMYGPSETVRSNLVFAVNKWCQGGTDRNHIENERPSGCSTNPDINCYGPIAGKQSFAQSI